MKKDYLSSDSPFDFIAPFVILPIIILSANAFDRYIYRGHWTTFGLCLGDILLALCFFRKVYKYGVAKLFMSFYFILNILIVILPFGDDSHVPLGLAFPAALCNFAIFYYGMNYSLNIFEGHSDVDD